MQAERQVISRASGPRFLLDAQTKSARGYIFPVLLGLIGAAILCALGVWQLQRLEWKEGKLAEIEARLSAEDVSLPEKPIYENDNYRGVEVGGQLDGPELHVLTSTKLDGPGFRVIRKLELLDDRKILIDLGFVPEISKDVERPSEAIFVQGNLIWPDETDGFTPEPNLDRNIWFARDVDKMAAALGTEPLMVSARSLVPELNTTPMPVTVNIPNDHLQYAITWFSLMVVWIGMTLLMLWRIKRADA